MSYSNTTILDAWWRQPHQHDRPLDPVLAGTKPIFKLEVVGTYPDGSIDVRLLNADGLPIRDVVLFGSLYGFDDEKLSNGRLLIAGSTRPWRLVRSWADVVAPGTRHMRLLLTQDAAERAA